MKKQIIVIHGADTFVTRKEYLEFLKGYKINFEKFKSGQGGWKDTLREKLSGDFEVVLPVMPNKFNAKYEEWKIWFEKFVPYFEPEVVLVGHSMGGAFLAKYLSQNTLPKKARAAFLIGAPYDDEGYEDTIETTGDFMPPENLEGFREQADKIFIYHSKDDYVVPFGHAKKYAERLRGAKLLEFDGRRHFDQPDFPELVEEVRGLYESPATRP